MGKGKKFKREGDEFRETSPREILSAPHFTEALRQESQPADSGAEVQMGDCKDCGKPWSMFESERAWWEKLIKERGYSMPSRCRDCRQKRRTEKSKQEGLTSPRRSDLRTSIAEKIRDVAEDFVSKSLDDATLYKNLYDLADLIESGEFVPEE